MDTIFALASAQGRAGVAVVRISGDLAGVAAGRLMSSVPDSRGLRLLSEGDGQPLDQALVLRFEQDKSFTGDEVIELHLHGSPAVVSRVLLVLGRDPDLRLAEPGEFTRRAMENGRLDLAQVEGLADLIDAETESQRRQAFQVFSGVLGQLAEGWRSRLLRAAALLEATIDFVDEDVPMDVYPEVRTLIDVVLDELQAEADGVAIAERIRSGFEVAIVGAPNVGKSTLLNRLAGRDAAITSNIAGTTRDVIEVQMDLNGLAVTLLDTAGLRDTDDPIEKLGVEKARERAANADLRIYMVDRDDQSIPDLVETDLLVSSKADLGFVNDGLSVSGLTGAGVDQLVERISEILLSKVSGAGVAIRDRHRIAMIRGIGFLQTARTMLDDENALPDLVAEELRSGIRSVDSLVGRIDVEAVLGEIFSSFCIGK